MAVTGDVTIAQDGGQAKLHLYLVALVRWCVSRLWSTATVIIHRLMIGSLPQITGSTSKPVKSRPAGRDHLHPEPKVECVVLHQPENHNLDVIFVHGLYGSLGNTWRQGEWRTKYQIEPNRVHLRRPDASPTPCKCPQCNQNSKNISNNQNNINKTSFNTPPNNISNYYNKNLTYEKFNENNISINDLDDSYNDNAFTNIDEKFLKKIKKILPKDDVFVTEKFYNNTLLDQVEIIDNYDTQAKFVSDLFKNCDSGYEINKKNIKNMQNGNDKHENGKYGIESGNDNLANCKCGSKCEVGCGCTCDDCYSPCWPQDWIKVDYPDARVISINYTSDPHLWRPLWVKESKRLCLHERADQMMQQLLALGVGRRPVVWVGHSKGGLFIKQIYCEAYEAYLKTHPEQAEQEQLKAREQRINNSNNIKNKDSILCETENNDLENGIRINENTTEFMIENENQSSNYKEVEAIEKSTLWSNSIGFMFYSVPHRGSPLALIKTPITARSVELIEISKDNSLVLSLQARWQLAVVPRAPLVRSVVETRRTLMSVLWLTIVSADSADPGIGALCGVSVDHREICKPTSRKCFLYTELTSLIKVALNNRLQNSVE